MNTDDKWRLVHTYRRAVANDHALPIRCPEDNAELVPVVDKGGDPALKCLACRTVYGIGLNTYEQMKNALKGAVDLAEREK